MKYKNPTLGGIVDPTLGRLDLSNKLAGVCLKNITTMWWLYTALTIIIKHVHTGMDAHIRGLCK